MTSADLIALRANYRTMHRADLDAAVPALLDRIFVLEVALRVRGVHPESCPKGVGIGIYRPPADARCECGIDAALADDGGVTK